MTAGGGGSHGVPMEQSTAPPGRAAAASASPANRSYGYGGGTNPAVIVPPRSNWGQVLSLLGRCCPQFVAGGRSSGDLGGEGGFADAGHMASDLADCSQRSGGEGALDGDEPAPAEPVPDGAGRDEP